MSLALLPARIAAGAFIVNSGLEKWRGDDATAEGVHGAATTAYPFLEQIEPARFLRLLAATEVAVGTAVAVPLVPAKVAGAALTAFSSGLLGLYLRTPGMRQEGSIRPTPQGIAVAKDSWLLGIGLSLLASGRRGRRRCGGGGGGGGPQ